MGGLKTKMS